jgi:hypothetical protein
LVDITVKNRSLFLQHPVGHPLSAQGTNGADESESKTQLRGFPDDLEGDLLVLTAVLASHESSYV